MHYILDSVDLTTYGLERTCLDQPILLDEEGSEVDPQNPNPRSAHVEGDEMDELDLIIRSFNERYYADWGATAEAQRVKFITLSHAIRDHADYEPKVASNPDQMTSDLAFKKIVDEVMARQRRQDIELYKLFAKDDAFASSFIRALRRVTGSGG